MSKGKEMIDIKSLMLGDLVSVDNKVWKVLELEGMACLCNPNDELDYIFCNSEDIEGIPLTAEILKKNGFIYNDIPFEQAWQQYGLSRQKVSE